MNLTSPAEVKALLAKLELAPRRSAGQNFLIDRNIRDIVLKAANVQPGDQVLEVGPGLGVLTEVLLEQADRLYAVEIDDGMHQHLYDVFAEHERMVLIHGDALEVDLHALVRSGANRLVSNLPYNVGSRILYDLASPIVQPEGMTVMLQRDVAERITATEGNKQYGLLTVWLQMFYEIRVVKHVNATCFYPRPKVGSSVVQLDRRSAPQWPVEDWKRCERLIKYCFTQRRKKLATILKGAPNTIRMDADEIRSAGIDPEFRPEQLAVKYWGKLSNGG